MVYGQSVLLPLNSMIEKFMDLPELVQVPQMSPVIQPQFTSTSDHVQKLIKIRETSSKPGARTPEAVGI